MSGAIIVMGVSGSGKTTLGRALADALGVSFIEGDALHPAANIAKMSAGVPLDDADRQPFLARVAVVCLEHERTGVVVSCSSLKRRYRDSIRELAGEVAFVLPLLSRTLLMERLARRKDHFMPAALLDSQLRDLESPGADEAIVVVDGAVSTERQVQLSIAGLEQHVSSQNAGASNASAR